MNLIGPCEWLGEEMHHSSLLFILRGTTTMRTITYFEACDKEANFSVNFSKENSAKLASKGNGFYGADASVVTHKITVFDSMEEWEIYTGRILKNNNPELYNVIKDFPLEKLKVLIDNGLNVQGYKEV